MEKISFAEALENDHLCVLGGQFITEDEKIGNKIPVRFSYITDVFHEELSIIEYIELWEKVKIYKVEEV